MTVISKDSNASQISFDGFIMGLASAALSYMGVIETKASGETSINLELARQNIQLLALLQEKTSGNLTAEEAAMISSVISDLRLRYVELTKENS
jgi:hypothetical protein